MSSAAVPRRSASRTRVLRIGAQAFGAVVSALTGLIWLAVLWLPSERDVLGHFGVVGAAIMLFIAILGVLAAHRGHANLMIGMFLAAFLPIGAFMLWTTQPMYRWLGLLNLLYFAAAILVRVTRPAPGVPGGGQAEDR